MLRILASILSILTAVVASGPWAEPPARPDARDAAVRPLPLPFFYDLYTFRGEGGRTAVVAAFAVPAGKLQREQGSGDVRYRFDVTLILADTARGSVTRTDDSVSVDLPRAVPGEHLLYTFIEVLAPPSGSTVQRVIMTDATTPGVGQLYGSTFPIPDYAGDRLMLSDIALGRADAEGGWRRGDVALALLPTSLFPESFFDVYYEIYNLPAGHEYATEIAIAPVDPRTGRVGRSGTVRLRFDGESAAGPDGTVTELRRVDTSIGRGVHSVTVTIRDERTGAIARRSKLFRLRDWGRGATLVDALPREHARLGSNR